MEVILRKYGNSIVAVLPPSVLRDLHLSVGQPMELDTTHDGKLILTPKRVYTLSEMLAQCDENAAPPADIALWDNAKPVGNEGW